MKKREKKQNNAYWDQFEEMLTNEEVFIRSERLDKFQAVEIGECAVLLFQLQSMTDWQFIGTIEGSDQLNLYAYPIDWIDEFDREKSVFHWQGELSSFDLVQWNKWVKPLKQQLLKAFVQAITGKKRLSEKQAEDWWKNYQEEEAQAIENNQMVLAEIKDYARTLPYQCKEVSSIEVLEPVFLKQIKEWRTIDVYQIPVCIQVKEGTLETKIEQLKSQIEAELSRDIYQSRSYQPILKLSE